METKTKLYLLQAWIFTLTFWNYAFLHATRKGFSNAQADLQDFWCSGCELNNTDVSAQDNPCMFKGKCLEERNASCIIWDQGHCNSTAEDFLGSLDTTFMFSYAAGLFVSGRLGDTMDLRIVSSLGMCGTAVTVALFGATYYFKLYNVYFYGVIWFLNGLLQSTGWPTVVAVMGNWFGHSARGFLFGAWSANASVGNIVGALVVSAVSSYGWYVSFFTTAGMLFAAGIINFLFLYTHPRECGLVVHDRDEHEEQRSLLQVNAEGAKSVDAAPTTSAPPPPIGFIQAVLLPGVIVYSLCYACLKLVNYALFFWLPYYLQNGLGWSGNEANELSTLYDVGGIVGGALAGWISDVMKKTAPSSFFMLVISVPVLYAYRIYGSSHPVNSGLMFLSGILSGGPANMVSSAISADLGQQGPIAGNSQALGTVTGIIDGTGSVGAALGQYFVTFIQTRVEKQRGADASWDAVFYMLMAMSAGSAVCIAHLTWKELMEMRKPKRNWPIV